MSAPKVPIATCQRCGRATHKGECEDVEPVPYHPAPFLKKYGA